jgi:hypothetical protein
MKRTLVALLAATIVIMGWATQSSAQGEFEVQSSRARSDFPNGIVFSLDLRSATGLDEARLVYKTAPDGVQATGVAVCSGGASASCTFELGATRRSLLIPGAEVTYFWRLTANGASQETEPQLVVYEDTRFDWQTVSEGNLTLWWYRGGEEEARRVLAAGRETLDGLGALLQTSVDFPVKIFYYGSAQDMQAAIISSDREGVVTLGEVVYSDTAMVSADSAPQEIARHEIAHIVVRQALRGPFGAPDWLNEGTAVFAQTRPLDDQQRALEAAIQSGRVLSVRSLSSASSGALGSRVSLFYGQSWSLVEFLVDTYGEEQFAELFRAFKEGATTADALEQVYGFNQDGLENAWREDVGLPPRAAPTPDEEQAPATPVAPPPDEEASSEVDDGGASIVVLVVIAALALLLAAVLLGAGVVIARRYG